MQQTLKNIKVILVNYPTLETNTGPAAWVRQKLHWSGEYQILLAHRSGRNFQGYYRSMVNFSKLFVNPCHFWWTFHIYTEIIISGSICCGEQEVFF